ncbi:uncharacterized protein N7525_006602 [Penicillium rubens]|uniref:uncharacterized protein n=1 Tax=Penicillium rubens TaxID=1108849 RepID=UPI002A59E5BF|nr:uncharacterized protein N7525_006602 [Penicillium rubens]KAJ5828349.1 hypothetical protein N7525_006602 [Penicillium rubens]
MTCFTLQKLHAACRNLTSVAAMEIPGLMSHAESADYGKAVPEVRELRIFRRGSLSSIEAHQH